MTAAPTLSQHSLHQGTQHSRFGFRSSGCNLLIPAGMFCEVLAKPPISAFPSSPPEFVGMTNLRGNFLPVYDLTPLTNSGIGNSAQASPGELSTAGKGPPTVNYVLILGRDEDAVGVIVDELPRSLNFNNSHRLEVLPDLPSPLAGIVETGYLISGDYWFEFDRELYFNQLYFKQGRADSGQPPSGVPLTSECESGRDSERFSRKAQ